LREGVEVEEGLSWVLTAPIAGVDDGGARMLGCAAGGARRGVPDHDSVRPQGVEGHDGVDERLALLDRAALLGDR
jgi:hypothetical protein